MSESMGVLQVGGISQAQPTNNLRFVEREVVVEGSAVVRVDRVLQQAFHVVHYSSNGGQPHECSSWGGFEWRDVPLGIESAGDTR